MDDLRIREQGTKEQRACPLPRPLSRIRRGENDAAKSGQVEGHPRYLPPAEVRDAQLRESHCGVKGDGGALLDGGVEDYALVAVFTRPVDGGQGERAADATPLAFRRDAHSFKTSG